MNYPTNFLRAFAVVCSWRIQRMKINIFLLIYKIKNSILIATKKWVLYILLLVIISGLYFILSKNRHDLVHSSFSSFCPWFNVIVDIKLRKILNPSIICPKSWNNYYFYFYYAANMVHFRNKTKYWDRLGDSCLVNKMKIDCFCFVDRTKRLY